jgi:hypothetical protein
MGIGEQCVDIGDLGGGVTKECSLYRGFESFMAKTRQKNEIFDGPQVEWGGNEVRFQNKAWNP